MEKTSYKIRFNPATTVDDINATLDAIDNAGAFSYGNDLKYPIPA